MKSLFLLPLGLALVAAPLATATPARADGHHCSHVHAHGKGHDHGDGTTTATLSAGLFFGTSQASFTIVDVQSGVATLAGEVDVTTFLGSFSVPITGSFDLVSGAFEAEGPVTGGTGLLAGVSGHLDFEGTENFDDATFVESIEGKLCFDAGPCG